MSETSVFTNKHIRRSDAQKLIRVYPHIPAIGDIVFHNVPILSMCPNWASVANTKPYTMKLRTIISIIVTQIERKCAIAWI